MSRFLVQTLRLFPRLFSAAVRYPVIAYPAVTGFCSVCSFTGFLQAFCRSSAGCPDGREKTMETVRETAAFLPVCLFVHRNRTLPQIPPEEVCYYYYRTRSSPLTSPTYFPNTTTPFLFSSVIVIESKFWFSASRRMEWSSFESTSESQ